MRGLADLLRPSPLDTSDTSLPAVMVATIIDTAPLRVIVPTLDGGRDALRAFGDLPHAVVGDEVRVTADEYGGLVVVAWEAA